MNAEDGNENKRKRSFESLPIGVAKNAKVDNPNHNARDSFLYDTISVLQRKMDVYEKKENIKPGGIMLDQRSMLATSSQPRFNAPPIPPFTIYQPMANNTQPTFSMVQTRGPTPTSSLQAGQLSTPNMQQMFPPSTPVWTQPQGQWVGQVAVQGQGHLVGQGVSQVQQQQAQDGLQMPFRGAPTYPQFYQ